MILYLVFAVVLLGWIENKELRFFAISFITVSTYAGLLFYIHKYRGGICENEMFADYKIAIDNFYNRIMETNA